MIAVMVPMGSETELVMVSMRIETSVMILLMGIEMAAVIVLTWTCVKVDKSFDYTNNAIQSRNSTFLLCNEQSSNEEILNGNLFAIVCRSCCKVFFYVSIGENHNRWQNATYSHCEQPFLLPLLETWNFSDNFRQVK